MTYLVDVNVLSEPTRPAPDAKVVSWLSANEGDFVVDSIILGELRIGILTLPRGRKRTQLERWFAEVVEAIDCSVALPVEKPKFGLGRQKARGTA